MSLALQAESLPLHYLASLLMFGEGLLSFSNCLQKDFPSEKETPEQNTIYGKGTSIREGPGLVLDPGLR